MKTKMRVGAVMAVLLLATYGVTQIAQDRSDGRTATVTVSWSPTPHPTGVRIVVRVAAQDRVKAKVFLKSPFTETYAVKRGDSVLVVTDPVSLRDISITCTISVSGSSPVTNTNGVPGKDNGHLVCLTTVS